MRFLITQVISSTLELKRNEWMTVFTFCDGDLRKAGLDSLPVKLTTGRAKDMRGGGSLSDPLLAPLGTQCRGTVAFRSLYYLFFCQAINMSTKKLPWENWYGLLAKCCV